MSGVDASSGSYGVSGGRVSTLEVANQENVAGIRVLEQPDHGNLTVNPDNTLALVMSMDHEFSGTLNMSYEVTYTDGSTQVFDDTVSVAPTTQGGGWGEGSFYMLEEDETGNVIVEYGDNHRDVHISGSDDALSLQDIANMEGLSVSQIDGQWLANNPAYGSSEGMALDSEAGMALWNQITGAGAEPSSHWLLFERGYEYEGLDGVVDWGTQGESPLHPVHITAYGAGDRPTLHDNITLFGEQSDYIVFSDLEVTGGIMSLNGSHLLFDNMDITSNGSPDVGVGLLVDGADGLTLTNSTVTDVYLTSPPDGGSWSGYEGTTGILMSNVDGLLIQNTLFDQNGFAPDYDPNLSASGGQAPSVFSHGVYIDYNNLDVTFRDNISMNAANNAMMIRSGGFIEDNVLANSNSAGNFAGGDWDGSGFIGNYTLFTDNVITSAGYHVAANTAGPSLGINNNGLETTMLDNIVAHLADPDNPEEMAFKEWAGIPVYHTQTPFYDDSIVYNWDGSLEDRPDQNTEGLNTGVLDATTIQVFTQQLLGDPNAGIPELAAYLRAQAEGELDQYVDADLIIAYFQAGFGLSVEGRVTPETLRFVPDALGDGIRWDNRLNWDSDDLPGTIDGDSVDLGGNWVTYGGTTRLEDFDFGAGGTLNVSHGRLDILDHTAVGEAGGQLNISEVGQVWMDGYTDLDRLDIDVDGGRFANTGLFVGNTDVDITDGQAILANDGADFILRDGSELNIVGDAARVGFDGDEGGTGVLLLDQGSELRFTAQNGQLGTIEEFRSGAEGDQPNIQTGVNLGDGTLMLDLSGLGGGAVSTELIRVDEVIGEFAEATITGLGGDRDTEIVIDYANDTVTLNVTAAGAGSGQNTVRTAGDELDAQANVDLWAALTNGHGIYPEDPPQDIPDEEDDLDVA